MFDECDFISHVIIHSWFYGRVDGHGAFCNLLPLPGLVL